jgi:hypothetical protein
MTAKKKRRKPSTLTVDVIEARSIVLVDEAGNPRVSLACSNGQGEKSFTIIHLNDDSGRPRITLQVDGNGNAGIVLHTANNASGVSIAVNDAGNGMSISDSEGQPGISMGFPGPNSNDPRGNRPNIDVVDLTGKRTWSVFEETINHS